MAHLLSRLGPWVGLPQQVLRAFNGRSSLPIHEIDKAKVEKHRAHIRPFPLNSGNVAFSAWRLAHAIKKADCLRWPSAPILWAGASGFLLENGHLFDWGADEFSLKSGMADFYADFTGSGLAGRVAQGMALLFLEEKGYAYVGRFETEWKQRASKQNRAWPTGKEKAPDFIAENSKNEWVLAESKGGFAPVDMKPNIKGALKDGLDQLDGWDKRMTPQPIKSFVIGTFLYESVSTTDETSVIAFVDPEPEAPENPVEFSRDAVRRANYASWLSVMGFEDASIRVRYNAGETQRRLVPIVTLAGRKFAVSIASVSPNQFDVSSREFWDDIQDWPFLPFGWFGRGISVELIGLDLTVLQTLGTTQLSSKMSGLMELKPNEISDAPIEAEGGAFNGSIFSDGSLLGELRLTRSRKPIPDFEWIEVEF